MAVIDHRAELERALAACSAAGEWSAELARDWWQRHGAAPAKASAVEAGGRTVEIDPGTRAALLHPEPALLDAQRRE